MELILNFWNEIIINFNIDEVIMSIFVGLTAFLIALSIFVIEKQNSERELELAFYINLSGIRYLIMLMISIFILILFISFFSKMVLLWTFLILLIAIAILCLAIAELWYFISLINTLIHPKFRSKQITNFTEKQISRSKKEWRKKESEANYFLKKIKRKTSVVYLENYYDSKNEYVGIKTEIDGVLSDIDVNSLVRAVSIKVFPNPKEIVANMIKLNSEKISSENKPAVIIKKLPNERVYKWDNILLIHKDFFDKTEIKYDKFVEIDKVATNVIYMLENDIDDLIKKYINELKNDNIISVYQVEKELTHQHNLYLKQGSRELIDYLYDKMRTIRFAYELEYIDRINRICHRMAVAGKVLNNKNEFYRYYNLYFYSKFFAKDSELRPYKENSQYIFSLDYFNGDSDYNIYMLNLYQELLKEYADKAMYQEMFEIFPENTEIFEIEIKQKELKEIEASNIYDPLEKDNVFEAKKLEFENSYIIFVAKKIVQFGILEYLLSNKSLVGKKSTTAIVKSIFQNWFNFLNTFNVIELFYQMNNDKKYSDLMGQWHFWNMNSDFNEYRTLSLILMKADVSSSDQKSYLFNVFSSSNIYFFKKIISAVEKVSVKDSKFIDLDKNELEKKKKEVLKYLNKILRNCEDNYKNEILNSKVQELTKVNFVKNVEALLDDRKDIFYQYMKDNSKVIMTDIVSRKPRGYNTFVPKKEFIENENFAIDMYAKNFVDGMINDENTIFLSKIFKNTILTDMSIEEIFKKYDDDAKLCLFIPYNYNSELFERHRITGKLTFKKNKKIEVIEGIYFSDKSVVIADKSKLGTIKICKLDENEFSSLNGKKTRVISLVDAIDEIDKIKSDIPEFIVTSGETVEEFLKNRVIIRIYQDIRYELPKNCIMYRKKI